MKQNEVTDNKLVLKIFLVCLFGLLTVIFIESMVLVNKTKNDNQAQAKVIEELEEKNNELTSKILENENEIEELKEENEGYSTKFEELTVKVQQMESDYDAKLSEYSAYEDQRKISVISDGLTTPMTESELANTFDITTPSLATVAELDAYLEGTGLEGLGCYFKYEEMTEGINAVALMSLAIIESGSGTSNIAVKKNNILSWAAYDTSAFTSAASYSSMAECLEKCTPVIVSNYLTKGGTYYHGKTLKGMNKSYSSSDEWKTAIANVMKKFDTQTTSKLNKKK
jgi:beta-N-acetylglucosaminidase